jgi:hypothetical protein
VALLPVVSGAAAACGGIYDPTPPGDPAPPGAASPTAFARPTLAGAAPELTCNVGELITLSGQSFLQRGNTLPVVRVGAEILKRITLIKPAPVAFGVASSTATLAKGGSGATSWTDPSEALAAGGGAASARLTNISTSSTNLELSGFTFGLPPPPPGGSVIVQGIAVDLTRKQVIAGTRQHVTRVRVNGGGITRFAFEAGALPWTSTFATETFGGPDFLWAATAWTAAALDAMTVSVSVGCEWPSIPGSVVVSVDVVVVRAHYAICGP